MSEKSNKAILLIIFGLGAALIFFAAAALAAYVAYAKFKKPSVEQRTAETLKRAEPVPEFKELPGQLGDEKKTDHLPEVKKQDAVPTEENRKTDFSDTLNKAGELLKDEEKAFEAIKLAEKALKDIARTDEEKKQAEEVLKSAQAKFAARRPWTAVLDFNVDKSVEARITGSAVAVKLEQSLGSLCRLVTRSNFEKAMKELQFQTTDLVDKTKAKQFGKMLGAEYLVTGSVVQFGKDITIAAQLFQVETGVIRQTAEVTSSDVNEFNYLFPEIVRILSMNDAEKKAYLEDKANYPKHLADGNAAVSRGDFEEAVKCFKRALTAKRTPEAEAALRMAESKNRIKQEGLQRKALYDQAMAEGNKAVEEEKWKNAESAFNKALAVSGFEEDAAAKEGLKIVQGGPEAKRRRTIAKGEFLSTVKKADELFEKAVPLGDKSEEALELCDNALLLVDNTVKDHNSNLSATDQASISALKTKIDNFRSKIWTGPVLPGPEKKLEWKIPDLNMDLVWVNELNGWVGLYEVTNLQFRKFQPEHDSKDFKVQTLDEEGKPIVTVHSLNGDRQPVVNVNMEDVQSFIKWLNDTERRAGRLPEGYRYRLPSKEEWTMLAECGDRRPYPWGEGESPKFGNYGKIQDYDDGFPVTCPVEKSGKNGWGLYGIGGNAAELTQKLATDPSFDSWRGGSWEDSDVQAMRTKFRNSFSASRRSNFCGFRIVLLQ
ncbi:MAG: SUMF1/EgtB/PvdO family nonheme iron enzyme [Victivallales bacterium]